MLGTCVMTGCGTAGNAVPMPTPVLVSDAGEAGPGVDGSLAAGEIAGAGLA